MKKDVLRTHAVNLWADVVTGRLPPRREGVVQWDERTDAHHAAVPEKEEALAKQIGIERRHTVLVPFSFSGEWVRFAQKAAGKENVVALDFSLPQLLRSRGQKVLAAGEFLPFKDQSFDHILVFEPTSIVGSLSPVTATVLINELLRVGKKVHVIVPPTQSPKVRAVAGLFNIPHSQREVTKYLRVDEFPWRENMHTLRGANRKLRKFAWTALSTAGQILKEKDEFARQALALRYLKKKPVSALIHRYEKERKRQKVSRFLWK